MTFVAKIGNADDLKAIIGAVSTLVETATFRADAEGIAFRGMDPSHIALIDVSWPNSAFEKYECDKEIKFGVIATELAKLLKRAAKGDGVEISVPSDSKLAVSIADDKKFKIRLTESTSTDTPLPKLTFDAKVTMPLNKFEDALNDINTCSEYVTMDASADKVVFSGSSDSGEAAVTASKSDEEKIHGLDVKEPSSGTYGIEYLLPIVRAVSSTVSDITFEYSSSKPLRVEFAVANMARINFYLAPRVDS